MDLIESYRNCVLCPRKCRVNRVADCADAKVGYCRETHQLRVAHVGPHFGEEPPISGKNGSGTIFFTGCSLKCSFCQNHQISHYGLGTGTSVEELGAKIAYMIEHDHVHNVNFVTPDHFFPHLFQLVSLLRRDEFDLPIVYNLSGYQSVEALKSARDYVDIYLPDFKYSDPSLASALSKCRNYPQIALEAIAEMVRHLILPGKVANSINSLTTLFVEFGPDLPLSLMSQYHPVVHQEDANLKRLVSEEEFDRVYLHARELGFEHLFVQFPEKGTSQRRAVSPFLPDFERPVPFPAT